MWALGLRDLLRPPITASPSTRMTCVAPHEPVPRAVGNALPVQSVRNGLECGYAGRLECADRWAYVYRPLCCALNTGALSRGTTSGRSVGDGIEDRFALGILADDLATATAQLGAPFLGPRQSIFGAFRDHATLRVCVAINRLCCALAVLRRKKVEPKHCQAELEIRLRLFKSESQL